MIGQQIQHYRILRQLGAGGMGVVYEAEDTRLGRHVALKFLPESHGLAEEHIERFLREARIASSLNHPNICTIHDVGVHEGRHFIAMELLEGESLRSRVHGQPLPVETVLEVGAQLADALDAAHAKGIVHRDIKPANVFITKRGQAKLLDFGIAKLGGDGPRGDATAETRIAGEVLTTPGTTMGSVNYMSPEQARGEELDARTDLFSLGLVLYEMTTGRQAFAGATTAVVFDAILNRQPADPRTLNPDLPEEVARVLLRALEKDRRMRYQTAADLGAELGRIRRDTSGRTAAVAASSGGATTATAAAVTAPTAATSPATGATTAPVSRRVPFGIAAAVVVLAAAGWYFFGRGPSAPPLGERDTLLVADFVNTTGDTVFDDALRQAVAVQLQQSPFIVLLPDPTIQRTLRLMQRPPDEPVTGDVAREACQRAGARATVEGSIAPLGSAFVITIGVHNCETGASLARQQVQAGSKEEVLAQLGTAVRDLRQHLGESLASIEKYDVPVTTATTASLEALRAYGQGLRTRATRGDQASVPFFEQAVERDPQFALAWAKLGVVTGNLGRLQEASDHARKAHELRDKVSEYERMYIDWNYASRVLRDPDAVRTALELLVAAYPNDFAGRNNLGVHYNSIGQMEEALKHYEAATAIAPHEPGPLSNAAYVLMTMRRLDEASALVDRSLAIRPDPGLALARWIVAAMAGSARAPEFLEAARALASAEQIMQAEANLAVWRGQFIEFQRIQGELIDRARTAGNTALTTGLANGRTLTLALFLGGEHVKALESAVAAEKNPGGLAQLAAALAMVGDIRLARAALARLPQEQRSIEGIFAPVAVVRAYIAAADGRHAEAIEIVQKEIAGAPRAVELQFFAGDLHARAGERDQAIANYRRTVEWGAGTGPNPVVPVARLRLAILLHQRGDTAGAREQVDVLLVQWKDADTEFPMLVEARGLGDRLKTAK